MIQIIVKKAELIRMRQNNANHTFVVCAYQESPYLKSCLQSLLRQTTDSNILVSTSTPNSFIDNTAKEYGIPVYINPQSGGITQDWNYAYSLAETDFVTIAHQDDIYGKHYTEVLFEYVNLANKPLIFFSDYVELRNHEYVSDNQLLRIKRIMLSPLRNKRLWDNRWIRRRILSFGSPICCPSVTYAKHNLPDVIFENHFHSDEDWEAWEKLSRLEGEFVFMRRILMAHRIHEDSETSRIIGNHLREEEDLEMLKKFWPNTLASVIARLYQNSEKSNKL